MADREKLIQRVLLTPEEIQELLGEIKVDEDELLDIFDSLKPYLKAQIAKLLATLKEVQG